MFYTLFYIVLLVPRVYNSSTSTVGFNHECIASEIARLLEGNLIGDEHTPIHHISPIDNISPNSLVFADSEEYSSELKRQKPRLF